jgi:hypothetical protein
VAGYESPRGIGPANFIAHPISKRSYIRQAGPITEESCNRRGPNAAITLTQAEFLSNERKRGNQSSGVYLAWARWAALFQP